MNPNVSREFLQLALDHNVLRFGEFTLKSGRISPYFFNAGLFNTGSALASLGKLYAQTIKASGVDFDVLFGPAYKGIPLAAVTAAALYTDHQIDIPYAFNRKEAKAHGEGGNIVGAALKGRVAVIDDVMTAGTAIRESVELIRSQGAELAGVYIALDRQERGAGEKSAVQEVARQYQIPVHSIANVESLMALLDSQGDTENLARMQAYKAKYGIENPA